jgi:hypothetical protein
MIRVLSVDDHPLLREGIAALEATRPELPSSQRQPSVGDSVSSARMVFHNRG